MASAGGALMGGLRYEQLCRVSGWVQVENERQIVSGTGMRVRRRGVRNMSGAPGHCQHSALFPSGRAFGANAFWPAADGSQSFNEGFVVAADGVRQPARLAEAPWMRELMDVGEALPLVLDTPAGVVRIEGRTVLKTFDHHHFEMADTSVLEQGWRATCGTERRPSACSSAARCASASPTCRLPEPRRNSAESDREPASRRTRDRRRGRHRGGDLSLAGARESRGRRARPRRAQYDGGH
jgi:hypothetical protein